MTDSNNWLPPVVSGSPMLVDELLEPSLPFFFETLLILKLGRLHWPGVRQRLDGIDGIGHGQQALVGRQVLFRAQVLVQQRCFGDKSMRKVDGHAWSLDYDFATHYSTQAKTRPAHFAVLLLAGTLSWSV